MIDFIAKTRLRKILTTADWVINILFLSFGGLFIYLFFQNVPSKYAPILSLVVAYIMTVRIKGSYIEFEYILNEDEFLVDKIISKKKRKSFIKINNSAIEIIAPAKEEYLKKYNTDEITLQKDVLSDKKAFIKYFMIYTDEQKGERAVLFFEPDGLMLKGMKNKFESKFVGEA
ncbi:MAG: hypothetical protein N2Z65_07105 [Clostridiales bacterium]|nr:hypothetical protein [Clostridiales bacterium]